MAEITFETEELQNNDNEAERLRKEIEELKYQIEREQREGDRLQKILSGASGLLFKIIFGVVDVNAKDGC